MYIPKLLRNLKAYTSAMLLGDWLILIASSLFIIMLFQNLWSHQHATKVQIRIADTIYGTYSLNQQREIRIQGPLGPATISIMHGKARFSQAPCHNQYCVHQGWLSRSGQAAICLPNQLSLVLLGETPHFDSLNY